MPQLPGSPAPGTFKLNKATRKWEIYLPPSGWVSLARAGIAAPYIEGFDEFRIVDGVRQFGLSPEKVGGQIYWATEEQLRDDYFAEQEERAAFGPPPPGHIGPWPIETRDGDIDYDASNKALAAAAKTEKPSGAYASRALAQQAVASNPELAGFTPKYVPSTGQWQLEPPNTAGLDRETGRLQAEAQLVRQQQAAAQAGQPRDIDDLINQALINGDWDKAIVYDDFRSRPTNTELFRLALQYGETPEEFQAIMAFGQSLFQPPEGMFQPALAAGGQSALSSLPPELGGQQAPPTTAALQADAASQSVRFMPNGGTQRWDRENQVWVDVNLPDATSRPTANGGLLPIPTPKQGKGPFMPQEPTFAEEESTFGDQGVEQFQFKTPTPQEPPINNQEFEPFMAAGPDLGDVPTPEETKAAQGGKVYAPPGVLIPEFVKKSPNTINFYNPDKKNQLFDYANALDAHYASSGGYTGTEREGALAAKAGQLGIPNPFAIQKPRVQPTLPQSIFDRRKKKEPARQMFTAPRYIGAR